MACGQQACCSLGGDPGCGRTALKVGIVQAVAPAADHVVCSVLQQGPLSSPKLSGNTPRPLPLSQSMYSGVSAHTVQ